MSLPHCRHSFVQALIVGVTATVGCAFPKMHVEEEPLKGASGAGGANVAGNTNLGGLAEGGLGGRGSADTTLSSAGSNAIAGAAGSITGLGSGGTAAVAGAPSIGGPSCDHLATQCRTESCCAAIIIPGGGFKMGRSEQTTASDFYPDGGKQELPEHDASVSSFALDKYEVTVGRFRKFVEAYDTWHVRGAAPAGDAGANPNTQGTGWASSWTQSSADLPSSAAVLRTTVKCHPDYQAWTDSAAGNEAFPMNCVSWYEAFAFCIWDGGRLPTEAEWEYAAAGGALNRLYPWGSEAPDTNRANFANSKHSPLADVGSIATLGANSFGHQDLSGSLWEWTFDRYSESYYGTIAQAPATCANCANVSSGQTRTVRGGGWRDQPNYLRAAARGAYLPDERSEERGFRCARSP